MQKLLNVFLILFLLCGSACAASPKASQIRTDTTDFDSNLSGSDDTVQKALDTLDESAGGGSGDITQVWSDTGGDVSAMVADSGDTFDTRDADSSIPATRSTSLPATCIEGQMHQDTNSGGSEFYVCTDTDVWTKLSSTTDTQSIDISDETNLVAGDNITLFGDTLNVDNVFRLLSDIIDIASDTNLSAGTLISLTGDTLNVDNDLANFDWTNVDATDLKVGSVTQAYDADLDDLADGSLTGNKVGPGIDDDNVSFDDVNSDWTATEIGPALEELVSEINSGSPNSSTAKVHWSQLSGVPSGFEDGVDNTSSGGDGSSIDFQEDSSTVVQSGTFNVGTRIDITDESGIATMTLDFSEELIDISDETNLVAGDNLTLTGDTLSVDDVFVLKSGGTINWNNIANLPAGFDDDTDDDTQLTEEQVEDFVGSMLGGTETRITVTYDDAGNAINFVVDDMNDDQPDDDSEVPDTLTIDASSTVANGALDSDLQSLATPTAHRLFISDGSQNIQEVAFGADGTVLKSNGTTSAPSFETDNTGSGSGNSPLASSASDELIFEGTQGFDLALGTTSPRASTILELSSTNEALLVTRLTDIATGISSPVNGMIAYDETDHEMQVYIGGSWVDLATKGGFGITIDNGATALTTGTQAAVISIPYNMVISKIVMANAENETGSLVVDVHVATSTSALPFDNAESITGSSPLTISGGTSVVETALADWDTYLEEGELMGFVIDSGSTLTSATITIEGTLITR